MVTIKINTIEDYDNNFKIEKKAIYLFTMKSCPFCKSMKKEWNKAKRKNKNINIYEIESNLFRKNIIPKKISKYLHYYPTIIKYQGRNTKIFENDRNMENFDNFIKN
jgi:hypothetical protein